MLVAFVQSVVGPFHEDPGPFHERGCEETGEGANKNFLEEGRVHPFLTATMVPVSKLFAEDVDPPTGVNRKTKPLNRFRLSSYASQPGLKASVNSA